MVLGEKIHGLLQGKEASASSNVNISVVDEMSTIKRIKNGHNVSTMMVRGAFFSTLI
jgi:hypothetical protein